MTVQELMDKLDRQPETVRQVSMDNIELWSSQAAMGYAMAAADAAQLDRDAVARLADAMQAAMEHMTIDEAESYAQ